MYMYMYMSALFACMGVAILGLSSVLFLVTVSWHSVCLCIHPSLTCVCGGRGL